MKATWTGERLETHITTDSAIEHLHRYGIAMELVLGKRVLDIASGEGYGSNLLSKRADRVIGVDISEEAVSKARQKYIAPNLEYRVGSADHIPCEDHSIDVVVSFETLEHHDKHKEMMREIKRVLVPGGLLIMSSPDKRYYSDELNYRNPFHVRELYAPEFKALMGEFFQHTSFYGQRMVTGSLIISENSGSGFTEYTGEYLQVAGKEGFRAMFNFALASDGLVPVLPTSMFDGSSLSEERLVHALQGIRNSWTYRIGNMIVSPLRWLTGRHA